MTPGEGALGSPGGVPSVAVVMGSDSDYEVMAAAVEVLAELGVAATCQVVSAHRSPERMVEWGLEARGRGVKVVIAGAGGAAHLPGMLASLTTLPVIGVPVSLRRLDGLDSLLSIVQMPRGVPVATVAIDNAHNAGLLAARILATHDDALAERLEVHRRSLDARALEADARVRALTAEGEPRPGG
jgi:5-(carboxyamino)imidazole ribonucleotide mutase